MNSQKLGLIFCAHLLLSQSAFGLTPVGKGANATIQRIKSLNGLRGPIDGLNCWGTTLKAAGLRAPMTYTSDKEFRAVLANPKLCRQLQPGEKVSRFTIGAIRSETSSTPEELHGFLVLRGDRIFTKKDYTFESTPELRSMKTDFAIFADKEASFADCGPIVEASGLRVRANSKAKCRSWIDFFECQPQLATEQAVTTPLGRALLASLDQLFSEIENLYRKGEPIDSDTQTSLLGRMQPAISAIVDLPDSEEKDLLFGLYDSLAYQFMAVDANQKTKSEIE